MTVPMPTPHIRTETRMLRWLLQRHPRCKRLRRCLLILPTMAAHLHRPPKLSWTATSLLLPRRTPPKSNRRSLRRGVTPRAPSTRRGKMVLVVRCLSVPGTTRIRMIIRVRRRGLRRLHSPRQTSRSLRRSSLSPSWYVDYLFFVN